jgi:3-oxoacyl-[acyl-carrier-protein] synthase II
MRVARLAPFDRQAFLSSKKLRRMGECSQLWVTCCLMARSDAGRDEAEGLLPPPERRGIFLGTGFGCIDTTWDYLAGLVREGAAAASPFHFAESVANAPAGHSAIELDTRGANITLTSGDASAATSLEMAARAIREGRLDLAFCGGVDLMPEPLLRVLATLGAPPFVGEGCACLLLEEMDLARERKARIYGEVAGGALASDPTAPATEWSRDVDVIARVMERALVSAAGEGPPGKGIQKIFLHAATPRETVLAERSAAERLLPGVPCVTVAKKLGSLTAAGAFSLVAAALETGNPGRNSSGGEVLVLASSWGGSLVSLVLREAESG